MIVVWMRDFYRFFYFFLMQQYPLPHTCARSKNQPRALNRMRIANRATTPDSPRWSLESSISLPKLLPVPSSPPPPPPPFHCCHGTQNQPLIQTHRRHFQRWGVWHFYFLIHDSCPPQATTHTLCFFTRRMTTVPACDLHRLKCNCN